MEDRIALDGVTFDDVLLLPRWSDVTPDLADVTTRLTPRIQLRIPLLSAPMDTVTEAALAIALAQEGGLGVIHRNMPIERQAREVAKVKRSENGVVADPVVLSPDDSIAKAVQLMSEQGVSGFPVTTGGERRGKLVGILTRRDMKFLDKADSRNVGQVMTKGRLVTAPPNVDGATAERLMLENRVEKLLLVDANGKLAGLITVRDLENVSKHPHASRDERGRLRVGAAVGVGQFDRAEALLAADVDVIVIDTAHGHSRNVLETLEALKKRFKAEVIAGNVGTRDGAKALVDAGADAIKVGIGPGSICTTRIVTGVGVPQITAIMESVKGAGTASVIADGGIRQSGDIAKALAAGAHAVMLGGLFAGLDESPGELVLHRGRRFKTYRGMGSEGAMVMGSADRYGQGTVHQPSKLVPEGVEGRVAYRGALGDFAYQMVGGVRAAMGYCGCRSLAELRSQAQFVRISAASLLESHPHSIHITKESPNYTLGSSGGSE